ncbi:MAG: hypothetical protein HZC12_06210 [Nitrospirae bacterium]|nr:hypothetical protein [Nitrospirota bacterium]
MLELHKKKTSLPPSAERDKIELFMLYDEYIMEGPYICIKNNEPRDCWRIKASGIVNIKPITDGTVTYTPIQGGGSVTPTENLQNGKYRTRYTTGPQPAVNRIDALGEATVEVPEVFYDPFTGEAITEDYETPYCP